MCALRMRLSQISIANMAVTFPQIEWKCDIFTNAIFSFLISWLRVKGLTQRNHYIQNSLIARRFWLKWNLRFLENLLWLIFHENPLKFIMMAEMMDNILILMFAVHVPYNKWISKSQITNKMKSKNIESIQHKVRWSYLLPEFILIVRSCRVYILINPEFGIISHHFVMSEYHFFFFLFQIDN